MSFSPVQESRIIEHMNNGHNEALRRYARDASAVMAGIDGEGFDVLTAGKKLRFDFDVPVRRPAKTVVSRGRYRFRSYPDFAHDGAICHTSRVFNTFHAKQKPG